MHWKNNIIVVILVVEDNIAGTWKNQQNLVMKPTHPKTPCHR